ncbi:hypothetical protein ACWGQ5_50305 [Streptomyces sp. NPDC055722]
MPAPDAPTPSAPLPGTGFWHRAVRLLARLHGRRTLPAHLSRAAQIRALVDVLDEAVAVQHQADAAVASCGEPGPVTGPTAQECGRAGSAFHQLRAPLCELPLTEADLLEDQAHAPRLPDYDQWMVRQSLNLAFTAHPDAGAETARIQINGLGRPADDLRRLRDTLMDTNARQEAAARRIGETSES